MHGLHLADQRVHFPARACRRFDGRSNSYVRDWGDVDLPWLLLGINTLILLASSVTIEFARRQAATAGCAGSGEIDSGNLAGR